LKKNSLKFCETFFFDNTHPFNHLKNDKMGMTKKHAKGRLDKFYHLAKDQGYRARSAFKLIQLNKKYSFLQNSRVVVDLCAAPGGWLQVCQKIMTSPVLIVGIDLEKIKPVGGCITLQEDITTAQCRTSLKRELKTWKADCFLHDGAPNVGVSWSQDAFSQSELTLSACKLATEFLVPGGTFVTKVFRSKEYNKLMYVFSVLFDKVEATKPTASRTVSAEIFVVCRGYKAPKKIDPRLLDPKFAFKEMDDLPVREVEKQGRVMNDLMHPEKRKRHRDGYEDGDYTLYRATSVMDFIKSDGYLDLLARSSAFTFDDEEGKKVKELSLVGKGGEEIVKCCDDLKVLGRKEFKELLRWRDHIRVALGLVSVTTAEPAPITTENTNEDGEEDIEMLLKVQKEKMDLKDRKKKKKQRERKAKEVVRMRLGMGTDMGIGMEMGDVLAPEIDFGDEAEELVRNAKSGRANRTAVSDATDESEADTSESEEENGSQSSEEEEESEDELTSRITRLDKEVDQLYAAFEQKRAERDPKIRVKRLKEGGKGFEEWYGLQDTKVKSAKGTTTAKGEFDSSDSDSSDDELVQEGEDTKGVAVSKKAEMFFTNPVFQAADEHDLFDKDLEESMFKEEVTMSHKRKRKTKDTKGSKVKKGDVEEKGFEIVPATQVVSHAIEEEEEEEEEEGYEIDTPVAYTLAQRMLTKSGKRDMIDEAYNRYAFNDPADLPPWYIRLTQVHH
jgi:AdoMet-dependent rRNA methyltransferase SPB1